MSFFANLSILKKFIAAFSLVLLFTAGLGAFAFTRVSFMTKVADGLEANIAGTSPIEAMARCGPRLFGFASETALTADPAQLAALAASEDAERKTFAANWPIYRPTMDPGRESKDGNGFFNTFNQMSSDAAEVVQDVDAGNRQAAAALVTGPMASLNEAFNQEVVDDLGYQGEMAADHASSISAAQRSSEIGIFFALTMTILMVCSLVWLLIANIGKPIGKMTDTMRRLARGDMNAVVADVGRHDEIGDMARAVQVFKDAGLEKIRLETDIESARQRADEEKKHREAEREVAARQQENVVNSIALGLEKLSGGDLMFRLTEPFSVEYEKLRDDFNSAMGRLQDTMKVIMGNTSGIRSSTGEISAAADDLSRRTEQQAASLEETAAALDQITATVRKTAEGATHAREVVGAAQADAERSGVVVREAVAAMSEIETSSQQISQIIGVIDEIAFQTNLLALNAGVEAARAGDAGRGFAVVASEVRALAQRSAGAAKEIKALISTSTQQVGTGVKLVDETGAALTRIVKQVAEIHNVVIQIAASAQEQATGLHQVNAAVNQMDQVTQQNAAMVEQSTAASHSLAQETEELARLTARFQVGEMEVTDPAIPRSPAGNAAERPFNSSAKPTAKHEVQKRYSAALKPLLAAAGVAEESWEEF
ncbi:MAG: HAMP domain-containing methyl-accepting chemotaxis protein [Acidiphilium sp.]